MPDAPTAWTDGSLVQDPVSSASSSVFFSHLPSLHWDHGRWVIWMTSGLMMVLFSLVGVSAVPGNLQSVQRAELWEVILALQASVPPSS